MSQKCGKVTYLYMKKTNLIIGIKKKFYKNKVMNKKWKKSIKPLNIMKK